MLFVWLCYLLGGVICSTVFICFGCLICWRVFIPTVMVSVSTILNWFYRFRPATRQHAAAVLCCQPISSGLTSHTRIDTGHIPERAHPVPSADPIPYRLVQRIRSGDFLEMRDLLADNMALHGQLEDLHGHIPWPPPLCHSALAFERYNPYIPGCTASRRMWQYGPMTP